MNVIFIGWLVSFRLNLGSGMEYINVIFAGMLVIYVWLGGRCGRYECHFCQNMFHLG